MRCIEEVSQKTMRLYDMERRYETLENLRIDRDTHKYTANTHTNIAGLRVKRYYPYYYYYY